ncbi:nucleotide exchange factor GrpE [Candidatus Thiosymbion oneisti]|uniref:nucleotide exchange factor GrpE n=1 Tax=Candidatus Thiosymbion oneisti TaxID=589554 RepID=UPI000A70F5B9|nr:nucleotide exchange factor GrpE [Candidatus Thiosymbion oneisti]
MVAERETDKPEQEPEGQDESAQDTAETTETTETTEVTEGVVAAEAEETAIAADDADPAEDATPERLTALLEDARAKADENWDQLLRVRAEMENLKRRQANELEKAHKFALDGFVRELLQVRDSLELGHTAALDEHADLAKLREGTELTLKLLADVMGKFGVEQIDPKDEPFDPAYHQAMTIQPTQDAAPNTVVTVIQKGYLLNGRLVRPAMVIVAAAPASEQA